MLQVPVPQPGAVHAEGLGALDHAQRAFVAVGRTVGVEGPDGQEAEAVEGLSVEWHVTVLPCDDRQRSAPMA